MYVYIYIYTHKFDVLSVAPLKLCISSLARTQIRTTTTLPIGRVQLTVTTTPLEPRRGTPLGVTIAIDGATVAEGTIPISAPLTFTANDGLDIGKALGSPVSLDYHARAPFEFNGHIEQVHIRYVDAHGAQPSGHA